METNKDLMLRNLKYFSDFLMSLTKQKAINLEVIDSHIHKFLVENYNITSDSLLRKSTDEIIAIIETDNYENIKDLADIYFIKYTLENNANTKSELSTQIIGLYESYQIKTSTYSFDIQSKISILKNISN
ncbi:hypothetical protein FLBR109950_03110 [Flavobacterium branchiophilum]|uniref:Uncharacterized protein n=1 Tax=Flavobacterium branchiophilum (strain FL-15) TaxID=1034807 RepID=G2Z3V4_FLABF|nr:hypothetical protein [Flavobacterium branchiophilum]CCB68285.1 Hypothetical protein FBFL15_0133 [Flavobacterium branchiophilum FL-15]